MRKTSVYLSDEELDGLHRVSVTTGRSQSALIREGVNLVLAETGSADRVFHSMGIGMGPGGPTPGWDSDEVYREVRGED